MGKKKYKKITGGGTGEGWNWEWKPQRIKREEQDEVGGRKKVTTEQAKLQEKFVGGKEKGILKPRDQTKREKKTVANGDKMENRINQFKQTKVIWQKQQTGWVVVTL